MGLRSRASALTVSILACLVAASVVAATGRAAAPDASQASNPASKLGVWEGHWTYNERDYETPYSHANTNSGTGDCSWAPNRGFMVCDYHNSNPGNGVPANDLAVFSFSSSARTYARVGIFKDAKPFEERVTIDGNAWITQADISHKGSMLVYRDVHTFSQDSERADSIIEISADKGRTWTVISRFISAKNDP
jgi:hypothetical protein